MSIQTTKSDSPLQSECMNCKNPAKQFQETFKGEKLWMSGCTACGEYFDWEMPKKLMEADDPTKEPLWDELNDWAKQLYNKMLLESGFFKPRVVISDKVSVGSKERYLIARLAEITGYKDVAVGKKYEGFVVAFTNKVPRVIA